MIMDTTPALLERANIYAKSSAKSGLIEVLCNTVILSTDRRVSCGHGIAHEKPDPSD